MEQKKIENDFFWRGISKGEIRENTKDLTLLRS